MITYDKLWKKLSEKGISQYKLINEYDFSPSMITRLKRNEIVKTRVLDTLCYILDCDIGDIAEHIKEKGTAE